MLPQRGKATGIGARRNGYNHTAYASVWKRYQSGLAGADYSPMQKRGRGSTPTSFSGPTLSEPSMRRVGNRWGRCRGAPGVAPPEVGAGGAAERGAGAGRTGSA